MPRESGEFAPVELGVIPEGLSAGNRDGLERNVIRYIHSLWPGLSRFRVGIAPAGDRRRIFINQDHPLTVTSLNVLKIQVEAYLRGFEDAIR